MRVLLVEDNLRLRDEIRRTIQAIAGARVVQAASTGAQATAWLARHPDGWDLAVVDLFLEQGHGFEVLRSCRRRRPHQKAVVLTNYTREPVKSHALQAGADAFFDKSFDMDALVDYCVAQARTIARDDGELHRQAG